MTIILPGVALADLTIYERDLLATAKLNKIMLGVEDAFEKQEAQAAFIQAIERGTVRLLDVTVIASRVSPQPRLLRVFGITEKGEARLNELTAKSKIDSALKSN